ncbi:MAG: hypothetical protein CVT59_05180 [Actinobacteria bacterium HGW-Actinobacteria-1]|jgi:formate dehydrogenase major subunit|nr:MAG: hypothetical protein CVT59_05180 [Actinobacteria bacterium HGW-Actinobacteria-1]
MTNNWVDLDNSTMFLVCGANPAENHPASIGHVNTARFDVNGRGRNAALIVVDPRQTRTARMINAGYDATNVNDMRKHDRYVRIRPGTNIAFINGVLNSIITWMYANPTEPASINFFAWHNSTAGNAASAGRAFVDDGGTQRTLSLAELATAQYSTDGGATWTAAPLTAGWPKYCDSRIKVNSADSTGVAGPILTQNQIKDDYQRAILKSNSNAADGADWRWSNMPVFAANVDDPDCVFQKLKNHVAKYDATTVSEICGCTVADIAAVRDAFIANSRCSSSDFGAASQALTAPGYRAACIMYAMGATQFTSGSQGVRSYAVIQTLMGNMGRAGGGINALRGIHNVQGSTDMGTLYDLIPGYSGNPGVGQAYTDYSNKLFGNRVLGTTTRSAYNEADIAWQQRGFFNMTREWFGSRALGGTVATSADFDKMYACWPKGNGVPHIESFRRMDPVWAAANSVPNIRAAVVWGQNPAVTEPNQSAVRTGLEALDLLVCTDMFANETAQCKRKADGVTYLLPACSHVEEAGSVTSSGRWIQWRDRARAPKGNSKSDLELLHRFAKALSDAGAFSHITAQWAGTALDGLNAYDVLWGKYGWNGTGDFEAVTGVDYEGNTLVGSEYVAEQVYKEMCAPLDGYAGTGAAGFVGGHKGTMWIYSTGSAGSQGGGYNPDQVGNVTPALTDTDGAAVPWGIANKAKSRLGAAKYAGAHLQYPRYGWAWLLNRRIFYNNGELTGDVADVFVAPGYLARLWTIAGGNTLADWSWLYRTYNQLSDMPDAGTGVGGNHVHPGRFPAFTEPYETPYDGTGTKPNYVATWGRNTKNGTTGNLIFSDSARGTAANFPLVLTSIRCVEHFQGGPITRNNPWNVELEPEPWIEINSVDALAKGIKDGDYVNITTARGDSITDQNNRTIMSGPLSAGAWNKGFKARVGVGTLANQRVAPGTVAIPWHWGDRGLGVGARANDLCIDAWDANTTIPEYKACLCKIDKVIL